MSIPFQPEPLDSMRVRFESAFDGQYLITETPGASGHRRHVFDFLHGLRLVVSFAKASKNSMPVMHVVASFRTPEAQMSAMQELYKAGRLSIKKASEVTCKSLPGKGLHITFDGTHFRDWLEGHFYALSRHRYPIEYGLTDSDGAFHFTGHDLVDHKKMKAQAVMAAAGVSGT